MNGKKMYKRVLAILLALVMVIPGVYLGESDKQEVKAAGTVSTDMLNVRLQVAEDRSDVIRFITSVDSLDYNKVGFEVTTDGSWDDPMDYDTKNVYKRIVSSVTKEEYKFSPKVVDLTSEYFATAMLEATEGIDYTVRAFVTTLDAPTVRVYGPERKVKLGDEALNTINMTVDFATTANATYNVYDGETPIGTAKVISSKNVRITLSEGYTATGFKSATVFTFKNGDTPVGTTVYRNYYTKYTGTGTEDVSWYEVDTDAENYVVASAADLQGLAKLVNNSTQTFADKTVTLVKSVVFNDGEVTLDEDGKATGFKNKNGTEPLEWTEIGMGTSTTKSVPFKGVFDGDDNTISGIYLNNTDSGIAYNGLFGSGSSASVIKNIRVENSYMYSASTRLGGIIGGTEGSIENAYVGEDVYLTGTGEIGGMVGYFGSSSSKNVTNCWFAGTIISSKTYVGGMIGRIYSKGTKTIEDCLFTGDIYSSGTEDIKVGGIQGGADNLGTLVLKNVVSNGYVHVLSPTKTGSVLGAVGNEKNLIIENAYTNDNIEGTTFTTDAGEMVGTGTGVINNGNTYVKGIPTKLTSAELQGEAGYVNTDLDFYSVDNKDGIWVATANGPELRAFSTATPITTFTQTPMNVDWYSAQYTNYTGTTINNKMALPSTASFEIDSVSDMYGFASLCNNTTNGETFVGDTIQLTEDIDFNPGWVPLVNTSGELQNKPQNKWNPIGRQYADDGTTNILSATNFSGTFDAQFHTISGIYVDAVVRDTGLFGITAKTAIIRNIHITNSYFDDNAKGYCGAVASAFRGTLLENTYVDESVVLFGSSNLGGITGMNSVNQTRKVSKCWFAGKIWSTGVCVGGILGYSYAGTNTIENCLFTGKITSTKTGDAKTGGIVGDASVATKTNVKNCASLGTVSVKTTTNVGADIGKVDTSKIVIENVYSSNLISHATNTSTKFVAKTGVTTVDIDNVRADAKTTLPKLYEQQDESFNNVWGVDTVGMPIIRWTEDGTLQVLLIGNSFCYYHCDELYDMLEAAGIKASVSNVYDSGCTVAEHVTFLNNDTERYQFITHSANGKTVQDSQTLKECLAAEDWDVISLQQHFDPSEAMTYEKASSITLSYTKTLCDYLKENHQNARLLWQQTWAYQVGYKGYGKNDFTDTYPDRCVLTEEKQTLNYEIICDVAKAVCSENNVERVPNGDAWQNARAVVGDILCDKTDSGLAADTSKDDKYHDGNIGGGQFLNACGWYEVITGLDCRDNTYVPSYDLIINTEFNEKLTTKEDVISALKEAAHTAVLNVNQ